MTIKATKDYANITVGDSEGRFDGELCDGNLFYADIDNFEWIRTEGDTNNYSKIQLICDALEHNYDGKYSIFFPFDDVRALYEVMKTIPNLKGLLSLEKDNAFEWVFFNGIIIKVTYRKEAHEKWFVQVFYQTEGAEKLLSFWNPEEHEVFEHLTDINYGRTFWVTKTNMFGKTSLPFMIDKGVYDRLSERRKRKYTII